MSSSGILGLRPAVFLLALSAGALAGGLAYWPDNQNQATGVAAIAPQTAAGQPPPSNPVPGGIARATPRSALGAPISPAERDRDIGQVFAAPGLRFDPVHSGNVFVGYRVLENESDPRFAVGDVIVSVNGRPVEGSAAGGELLIAALSNFGASVGTHDVATE